MILFQTFSLLLHDLILARMNTRNLLYCSMEEMMEAYQSEDVRLTDEYCMNAVKQEIRYLLKFDTDRLLAGFRETAGISTKGAIRYGGWENTLIGGHTIGHYLTACAQAYRNPNVLPEEKNRLYSMVKQLITGLQECQQHSKGKPGFIFGAVLCDDQNVERQFDHIEQGETDIFTQAWVPWYTMHKILSGLIDVYQLTGNTVAKEIAANLGDWVYDRISGWSEETRNTVLKTEYGGMNDCLYQLYRISGKEIHAVAAHCFDEVSLFEKVMEGKENALNKLHANTTIPKFLGAMNRYLIFHQATPNGNTRKEDQYLRYAESFFGMVIKKHTYLTGGNSEWEHFGEDGILDAKRTNCNCETCNTYNMLKLATMLYCATKQTKYMDYYENAYINTILSSQNPKTGMTTYFQPMATGYFKVYGEEFTKFWCCTGSGMESFTKLNSNLYFIDQHTIYITRYLSSVLTSANPQVRLIQKSELNQGRGITFTIDTCGKKRIDLSLAFRIPDWSAGSVTVLRNGIEIIVQKENGYLMIEDSFEDRETINLEFPMKVQAFGLPDHPSVVAFRYGPYVLSALLGTKQMETSITGVDVTIPHKKVVPTETLVMDSSIRSRNETITNIAQYMVKSDDSMSFTLTHVTPQLTFVPHYLQHQERYGIYWYIH